MVHSARRARERIGVPAGAFLLLTYGATMLVVAIATLRSAPALAGAGLLAPGLIAYALVAAGRKGVESVAGAPPHPGHLVISLLAGPAIMAAILVATTSSLEFTLPETTAIAWALGGAVSAELGWRGYLQPLLRTRYPALFAGLATGAAWAVWQIPMSLVGAGLMPNVNPIDVVAWALASAVFLSGLLEIRPRSTWYPIAAQAGFSIYLVMSAILPARAGSAGPLRMTSASVAVIGLVLLAAVRRNTIKRGRHLAT
jgi:membrane protease YdiL (CAAX protease family)